MSLSVEAIAEFRNLYKKNFKEEISLSEAREKAGNFLEFFKTIFKPLPIPEKNYEKK